MKVLNLLVSGNRCNILMQEYCSIFWLYFQNIGSVICLLGITVVGTKFSFPPPLTEFPSPQG